MCTTCYFTKAQQTREQRKTQSARTNTDLYLWSTWATKKTAASSLQYVPCTRLIKMQHTTNTSRPAAIRRKNGGKMIQNNHFPASLCKTQRLQRPPSIASPSGFDTAICRTLSRGRLPHFAQTLQHRELLFRIALLIRHLRLQPKQTKRSNNSGGIWVEKTSLQSVIPRNTHVRWNSEEIIALLARQTKQALLFEHSWSKGRGARGVNHEHFTRTQQ